MIDMFYDGIPFFNVSYTKTMNMDITYDGLPFVTEYFIFIPIIIMIN